MRRGKTSGKFKEDFRTEYKSKYVDDDKSESFLYSSCRMNVHCGTEVRFEKPTLSFSTFYPLLKQ
jgi:hypothetical protein